MKTDHLLELMRRQLRTHLVELQAKYTPEVEVEIAVCTDLSQEIEQQRLSLLCTEGAGT